MMKLCSLLFLLTMILSLGGVTALAYTNETETHTDTDTGDSVIESLPVLEEVELDEVQLDSERDESKPFSVNGNGTLVDDVEEGSKSFYTIRTANNNTFFLIIDKSSNSENVYMLSSIDENDLQDFIEEVQEEKEDGTSSQVVFEDEKQDVVESPIKSYNPVEQEELGKEQLDQEQSDSSEKNKLGTLGIIAVLGVGIVGGYYYMKIYKPKKDGSFDNSENMEYMDDEVHFKDESVVSNAQSEKELDFEEEDFEEFEDFESNLESEDDEDQGLK